jgi:threonine dehydratase
MVAHIATTFGGLGSSENMFLNFPILAFRFKKKLSYTIFMQIHLKDIQNAQTFLKQYLTKTPLVRNSWLSEKYQCDLYLKLETLQPIGSFKIRGATYKISTLTKEEKQKGVICASAGNHAQGVAWGSKLLGVNAKIIMPKSAPITKIENTKALGADIELFGDTYDEAFERAQEIEKESGRIYIHAFEDPNIIAGQGTVALEILEDLPNPDWIISSIGGGGLAAGIAIATKALSPNTKIMGVQALGAHSMVKSFQENRPVQLKHIETFADGIAVAKASPILFKILRSLIDQITEIEDEAIASAVLTLLEKAKILCEGACAVTLAAVDKNPSLFKGKKVVLVLGGGNIDVNLLSRIIDRGLVQAGRRCRVNVVIHDKPGALNKITQIIANEGANILQAIHDRNESSTLIHQTEVLFTLETKGPDHTKKVIEALRTQVIDLELH